MFTLGVCLEINKTKTTLQANRNKVNKCISCQLTGPRFVSQQGNL